MAKESNSRWARVAPAGFVLLLIAAIVPAQPAFEAPAAFSRAPERTVEAPPIPEALLQHLAQVRSYETFTYEATVSPQRWQAMADQNCVPCNETTSSMQVGVNVAAGWSLRVDQAELDRSGKQGKVIHTSDGGAYWVASLTSPGAGALRLALTGLHLPAGVALYWGASPDHVFGPYHKPPDPRSDMLWTNTVAGDHAYLFAFADGKAGLEALRATRLTIAEVAVIDTEFARAAANTRALEPCLKDGTCYGTSDFSNIESLRNAVAFLIYSKDGGTYICTGGLVNDNVPQSFIPYLLTANHCFSTEASADSLECIWSFQTTSCNSGYTEFASTSGLSRTLGADLLATSATNDFTFLKLTGTVPSGRSYLGWTTSTPTEGQTLYRLSHPSGAPQSYSTSAYTASSSVNCTSLPQSAYLYSTRVVGTTSPGSSGSPVVNADNQIVGQLYGSCAELDCGACDTGCGYAEVDGRFSVTYSSIESWINSSTTPPANDDFADAVTVSGDSGTIEGTNDHATRETGEPSHAGNNTSGSVWYHWTPARTAQATIDTCAAASYDTVLGIYTGAAVGALSSIAENDDGCESTRSAVTFTATSGVTYAIAVAGYGSAAGTFTLRWSLAASCGYAIDSASANFTETGGSGAFSVTTGTGCAWTASSGASWVTTSSSGSGNGTVSYTVGANTETSTRTATITVAGQTHTVNQAAATLPTVSVSAPDASASEAGDTGYFRIARTGATTGNLLVTFLMGGTASSTDYSLSSQDQVVIPAGSSSVDVTLTPVADGRDEGAERAVIYIRNRADYEPAGNPTSAFIDIADTMPVVSVSAPDASASEAGDTGYFRISRTGPTTGNLLVTYLMGGNASSTDYSLSSENQVVIPAGSASVDVTLTPVADGLDEGAERAVIYIRNRADYQPAGNPTSAYIDIADTMPVVSVSAPDASASESGDTGYFRISRTGPTAGNLLVTFLMGGNASSTDYSLSSQDQVTIPAGSSSVDVTLTPVADSLDEGAEKAVLYIRNRADYQPAGNPTSAFIDITDALPVVSVSAPDANAAEDGDNGFYRISRTGPTTGSILVTYLMGGTAGAEDYALSAPTQVTIPEGAPFVDVTLVPMNDELAEVAERASIFVRNRADYQPASNPTSAFIDLLDVRAQVTVTAPDNTASESGDTAFFRFARTGSTLPNLPVPFLVTGTAGESDYDLSSDAQVVIPSGASFVDVTLTPAADLLSEGTEDVVVFIRNRNDYFRASPFSARVVIHE